MIYPKGNPPQTLLRLGLFYFMAVKQKYYVYRASSMGYHYYGMTSNLESRRFSHCKTIFHMIKDGLHLKTYKETHKLNFHHKVCNALIRSNRIKSYGYSTLKYIIGLSLVFETDSKEIALEVESYLISKAIRKNKCCNIKMQKIHATN